MRPRSVIVVLLGMALWGQLAVAQVATGSISGVVQDETGAVVPGATVTVRNADTGISRALTTDAQPMRACGEGEASPTCRSCRRPTAGTGF